jgi:uncharacterized membrane protein
MIRMSGADIFLYMFVMPNENCFVSLLKSTLFKSLIKFMEFWYVKGIGINCLICFTKNLPTLYAGASCHFTMGQTDTLCSIRRKWDNA